MKKLICFSLLFVLIVLPLLVACAKPAPAPAPKPTPAPAPPPVPTPPPPPPFPEETITWIVPHGAGGFDTYSRAIAKVMPKYLPKKVDIIIKNVPAAGGRTGTADIYRSKPDGYTIGILNIPGHIVSQLIMPVEYDLAKMEYLGLCSTINYNLWVAKNSPFRSLSDLQQAKKPLRSPSYGFGQTGMLVATITLEATRIPYTFVTGYTAAPEIALSVIKGDVDILIESDVVVLMPYYKTGDLRPIAVISEGASQLFPDIPTMKKLGYPELAELGGYRIIAAPPGTPKERVKILEEALIKAMQDAETQEWSKKVEMPLVIAKGEEAKGIVLKQTQLFAKYTEMLKAAQKKLEK